ncbi:MAG TPA: hypothetical protein VGC66_13380 [Pyrinomonadaceae bacterium]|jgi:hypothetical protein
MPQNANVLMIRHGEKPTQGDGLAVPGQERAQAYVVYFQNYFIGSQAVQFKYLFASEDSSASHRPLLTIEPLSKALGLKINDKHLDKDYQKVADNILQKPKYNNSDILICWHHGEILQLAQALGVDASKLPSTSNWPTSWPGDIYGWLLQLCYDANGNLNIAQVLCTNENLMYDDYGRNPPDGK